MESLYLLIPIALVFCVIAIRLLLWAINSGQYDDLDKEAWRILMDDDAGDQIQDSGVHQHETPGTQRYARDAQGHGEDTPDA